MAIPGTLLGGSPFCLESSRAARSTTPARSAPTVRTSASSSCSSGRSPREVSPYLTGKLRPRNKQEISGPLGGWFVWTVDLADRCS